MKQIVILEFCFLISLTCYTQVKEGTIFTGVDLGVELFNTNTEVVSFDSYNSPNKHFDIKSYFGKAYKDNSVTGISVYYLIDHDINRYLTYRSTKFREYGFGFFLRKYKSLNKSFYLFGQANLDFLFSKEEFIRSANLDDFVKRKSYSTVINIYPGLSYQVSRKMHLEISYANLLRASYIYQRTNEQTGTIKINQKQSILNVQSRMNYSFANFQLGIRFLFIKD